MATYSALRQCDWAKASEYMSAVAIGMAVGIYLGPLAGAILGKLAKTAKKVAGHAEAAAERAAVRGEEKAGSAVYQGGRYGQLSAGGGLERHHLIANKVSSYSEAKGPAIQMEILDHRATASWGRGAAAVRYRAAQKALVDKGDTAGAIWMDIQDIRLNFGSKYDEAIMQALRSLG